MLFVHEVHRVAGAHEQDFEGLIRDRWTPAIGEGRDARLLWFLHHAHGTGPAYQVVTVTAVRDGTAWENLATRLAPGGDLHSLALEIDGFRHSVTAKVLRPLDWSPLQQVDLERVPIAGEHHDQALFMEDTAWPHQGRFAAYLEKAGTQYVDTLARAEEAGRSLLALEAAFVPAFGAGRGREVVLWQRVARPELLTGLFSHDVPEEHRRPGTWMHDALEVRDQWESRLLRAAPWSPLP